MPHSALIEEGIRATGGNFGTRFALLAGIITIVLWKSPTP